MNRPTSPFSLGSVVPFLVLALASCGDEPRGGEVDGVRTARRDVDLEATDGERFGYQEAPAAFLFEAPADWREIPPAQFRDLNFVVPGTEGGEDAECYVSLLQGGGSLENINRWRAQMSLEPFTEDELAALPVIELVGRKAVLVDLEGTFRSMGGPPREGARMLGAYAAFPAFGLSVKMVGDAATVGPRRDEFVRFSESLRLNPERFGAAAAGAGAEAPAAPATEPPPSGSSAAGLRWVAPAHWKAGEGSSMREVTFVVPGKEAAECWVTVLPGRAGGVLANLNRWRREVGQPALAESDLDSLPHLVVLGRNSVFLDAEGSYQGMSGPPIEQARMFGVVCDLGDALLFVKMVGRAADLVDERSHFIAFCESLST